MQFTFDIEKFNRIFPFFLLLDEELRIREAGSTLKKIIRFQEGDTIVSTFDFLSPFEEVGTGNDLQKLIGQTVNIAWKQDVKFVLRGQFEYIDAEKNWLFLGTPWFDSMDDLERFHLTINDFALHDSNVDLLHMLKTEEITNAEVKKLLRTISLNKKRLKESEENYRKIIENATDIIYKCNQSGFFTFVNPVAERITGYSREELMKMNYVDLIRRDWIEKTVAFYENQINQSIPTTYFEFPILTKSGEEKWIGQSVQFSGTSSVQSELTALAIDVTTRKRAEEEIKRQEEKYRNIIANMNLGLIEVNNEDVIQYVNQSFVQMSGYSVDELIGSRASDVLLDPEEKKLIAKKNIDRSIGVSDMYTVRVRNKKGEWRWWVISGAPRYNDKGDHVGSVGIHLDITEQKRMEQELKEAKVKAEQSSKAKESFLATMSHEIRTPLNAIIGITDLMQLNDSTRSQENFDILSFSAKNLLALITDILDLSKIESGKIEFAKNKIRVSQLVNGIGAMFKPSCEEKNVKLIIEIEEKMPAVIITDELRLSQIIINLLGNAVKFTHEGFIKVKAGMIDKGGHQCFTFQVEDSGIGIPANKLKTIFNSFEQAGSDTVRSYGGTGLGLSITKKLVELQDGTIMVNSKEGKGSVFGFCIHVDVPLQMPVSSDEQRQALSVLNSENPLNGKTILLVEDNLVNQKVATSYFDYWGAKYIIAGNGKEALEKLEASDFDIALIDLFMPVMDGFKTIRSIRKQKSRKRMPIVALTASAEPALMERALKLGANECLTKPFNSRQLLETLLMLTGSESQIPKRTNAKLQTESIRFLNLKNIEDASLGSKTFIVEMLDILAREIPGMMKESEHLLAEEKYEEFSFVIHRMKNNILTLGMESLRDDLRFLEEQSKPGFDTEELRKRFNRVTNAWKMAAPELEEARKKAHEAVR